MPVPKRKTSKSRRNKRSANKGMKVKAITACLTCKEPLMPHQACHGCGYYKGVKVLRTKADRLRERTEVLAAKEQEAPATPAE